MGEARIKGKKAASNCETNLVCGPEDDNASEASVSLFDCSVENHFKAMDTISRLCGEEAEVNAFKESEIERISSTIIFLRSVLLDNL